VHRTPFKGNTLKMQRKWRYKTKYVVDRHSAGLKAGPALRRLRLACAGFCYSAFSVVSFRQASVTAGCRVSVRGALRLAQPTGLPSARPNPRRQAFQVDLGHSRAAGKARAVAGRRFNRSAAHELAGGKDRPQGELWRFRREPKSPGSFPSLPVFPFHCPLPFDSISLSTRPRLG